MEGLLHCAKQSFDHPGVTFEHDSISPSEGPGAPYKVDFQTRVQFEILELEHTSNSLIQPNGSCGSPQSGRPASELNGFFKTADSTARRPQLKLLRINSRFASGATDKVESLSLAITRKLFEELTNDMQLNPWILWLISNKYDGFHYVKPQGGYAASYFFGFFHSAVVWVFEPVTAHTKILLISRLALQHEQFYALLQCYAPHLYTPFVPLMASAVSNMLDSDGRVDQWVGHLVKVERDTGFSRLSNVMSDLGFNVDALTSWSRTCSSIQINTINLVRHHENCMRAIASIEDISDQERPKCPNEMYKLEWDKSVVEILNAVQCLKMRAATFESYASYVKSRAEAQISVIFALLTHEDSSANLKAAEAAKDIATATKQDSSAMKTIAFMTMSFLPATFLATLFALPVLEWEQKIDVHTDGFQLYWIVAVASTVFVFIVWAIITKRMVMWQWITQNALRHRDACRRLQDDRSLREQRRDSTQSQR